MATAIGPAESNWTNSEQKSGEHVQGIADAGSSEDLMHSGPLERLERPEHAEVFEEQVSSRRIA